MCKKVYGYCRISRKEQSIDRQVRNISAAYPDAVILKEAYTGTKVEGRKEFERLVKTVKAGDTIVFDSVSRMSRNAEEGIKQYMKWFDQGVNLVFLKEAYINTSIYASQLQQADISTGKAYFDEGLKVILMGLAKEQIVIAFEQAEKEVEDLHQRTREGIETARLAGKQIGQKKGNRLNVKKAVAAKEVIRKHSRDFGGTLNDADCQKLAGVSRNSFYKYKREVQEEMQSTEEKSIPLKIKHVTPNMNPEFGYKAIFYTDHAPEVEKSAPKTENGMIITKVEQQEDPEADKPIICKLGEDGQFHRT